MVRVSHQDALAKHRPNSTHWGPLMASFDGSLLDVQPHPFDPEPSPLLGNVASATMHRARITEPVVRRGWLRDGPGPSRQRGDDAFVALGWDRTLDLAAAELERVRTDHGNKAIYGGSYGWASAGRFHHAQTQVHRFLNSIGGFVRSVNTYSTGAAAVILPHVLGSAELVLRRGPTWHQIIEDGELIVAFGGIPTKNTSVTPGGMTQHRTAEHMTRAAAAGIEIDLIGPLREDAPEGLTTRWHQARPGSDVAVMLGIAHTLCNEDLSDLTFIEKCCVGGPALIAYIAGRTDGVAKTPEWAAEISGLEPETIVHLARRMASRRTLINVTWSLQRTQYGEQPIWMGVALAALLGQIGLPGGGFAHGLGSMGDTGEPGTGLRTPTMAQGNNAIADFIPVARIADMLLDPGGQFEFDGGDHTYPDIRLAYWCGGNPFHHHQDLNRLRRAFARLDTFIVHEPYWTATAKHADIVFPVTTSLERNDVGVGRKDSHLIAMDGLIDPFGDSRDDYDIFTGLARRLGTEPSFTEGRTSEQWLRHIYDEWAAKLANQAAVPKFDEFWRHGSMQLTQGTPPGPLLGAFRSDPAANPLDTPSGRIELYSDRIASFGYRDCPGHPSWLERDDFLGSSRANRFPLHLIANQPSTRLHAQHDMGDVSAASKVSGREPILMNPTDAAARGLADGDVVRVHNDVGACLAGVVVSTAVMANVVQLATGAWFDPLDAGDPETMCVHGNPNMVTTDRPTSRLAQACTGQHALVQVELWTGETRPVQAHEPPPIEARTS